MKKILFMILAVAMLLGCLSGCSREAGVKETGEAAIEETVSVPQTVTVSAQAEREGKTLTMYGEVTVPDLSKLERITLNFDEEAYQAAGRELALRYYPNLQEERREDGSLGWSEITEEGLGVIFHCQDDGFEAGRCYYEYLDNDLNGQDMPGDEGRFFDAYYFTENIPNKLGMTSLEAAEKIGAELHKYSCFTYEPWSITACNIREDSDSSGYYSARMKPCFEGRPVYGYGALYPSTHMSAEGLFAFQGIVLLKETGRTPVSCTVDLDTAVERFQEEFVEVALRDAITVDRITAGYVASSEYDGTWTLHPAWIFEYRDGDEATEHSYVCAYKMETGTLLLVD